MTRAKNLPPNQVILINWCLKDILGWFQRRLKNYHTFLNFKLLVVSLKFRQTQNLGGKPTAEQCHSLELVPE